MRRVLQATVLVGALLLSSGCALVDRAGAAAVVDGVRYSDEQLAADFAALDKALGKADKPATMEEINRNFISIFVGDQLMQKAITLQHITPDKAVIGKLRRQLEVQLGGADQLEAYAATKGIAPTQLWMVLRNSVLTTDLGAALVGGTDTDAQNAAANAYLAKLAASMKVEVAPRFGAWDMSQMSAVAFDDLSTAAAV